MSVKREAAILLILLLQISLVLSIPLQEFYGVDLTSDIQELVPNDDDSSVAIPLSPSFPFYGFHYTQFSVRDCLWLDLFVIGPTVATCNHTNV